MCCSQVDFMNKIWICPFCLTRNHFPHHYASIAPDSLPAELHQECTTIEYDLQKVCDVFQLRCLLNFCPNTSEWVSVHTLGECSHTGTCISHKIDSLSAKLHQECTTIEYDYKRYVVRSFQILRVFNNYCTNTLKWAFVRTLGDMYVPWDRQPAGRAPPRMHDKWLRPTKGMW